MNLTPNEPVFFRTLPKTEDTQPNAVFVKMLGEIPGHEVAQIVWKNEKWTVDAKEVHPTPIAMGLRAAEYHKEIEAKRVPGIRNKKLAKALGISETTLRSRLQFVQNHLQKTV